MGLLADKLGYSVQNTPGGALVKSGPAGFFGLVCTATGGAVVVYDGTSAGGIVIYSKTVAAGEVVNFGGLGIAAKSGLFVTVAAGTVNILYT